MLLGLPAHQAHGPLVVLAEEPERLPVAAAQAGGHGALAPAPRLLRQPGQGPVGPQGCGRRQLPAHGAEELAVAGRPAAAQAAAAEVVTTLDGHRVIEQVQTDGAGQLLLEVLGFHDASPPQSPGPTRGAGSGPQAAAAGTHGGKAQPHSRGWGLRRALLARRRPFPARVWRGSSGRAAGLPRAGRPA